MPTGNMFRFSIFSALCTDWNDRIGVGAMGGITIAAIVIIGVIVTIGSTTIDTITRLATPPKVR